MSVYFSMEFFYDQATKAGEKWTRKPNKENKFALHVMNHVITIPDFFESFRKYCAQSRSPQMVEKITGIQFFGCSPYLKGTNEDLLYCSLCDGEWHHTFSDCSMDVTIIAQIATNTIYQHIMLAQHDKIEAQEKRLRKIESIFDQIKGRSSVLDEFMNLSEEVMKNEPVTLHGNATDEKSSK